MINHARLQRLLRACCFSVGILASAGAAKALALESFDDTDYIKMFDERDRGVGWNYALGLAGGFTDVGGGYQNYENLGTAGFDFFVRPPIPQFPGWKDRLTFRFSGNYLPLQVPDTVYYTRQELFTLSGSVLWRIFSFSGVPEHKKFVPFVGVGPALEWDHVSVHHPGYSGSGSNLYVGGTGSVGVMLPTVWGVRLIPEARYMAFKEPDNYWSSHTSYVISLSWWPPANVEE